MARQHAVAGLLMAAALCTGCSRGRLEGRWYGELPTLVHTELQLSLSGDVVSGTGRSWFSNSHGMPDRPTFGVGGTFSDPAVILRFQHLDLKSREDVESAAVLTGVLTDDSTLEATYEWGTGTRMSQHVRFYRLD